MADTTSPELGEEFEQADIILADALVQFQETGVSQYVYGMALLEIGVAALVNLDEPEAGIILADALVQFQERGVSQYVYGMALLEIGIAALVHLDEPDSHILSAVRDLIGKARDVQGRSFPIPEH